MRYGYFYASVLALALVACTPERDLQGIDPKDYYAEHPIKNALESRDQSFTAHFAPGATQLSGMETGKLLSALHGISPYAVESVQILYAKGDEHSNVRSETVNALLRHNGFPPEHMSFAASSNVPRNAIQINVNYWMVVLPDCPDWRTSPVTSYSNTMQGNFKCASEVNLGLMVADPRDLVRGTGDVMPDAERAGKVMQDYRGGKDFSTPAAGSTSGGGSSSATPPSGLTPPATSP